MKDKRKLIVFLIIIIIFILMLMSFIVYVNIVKNKKNNYTPETKVESTNTSSNKIANKAENKAENIDLSFMTEEEDVEEKETDYIIHKVENKTYFYTVKDCIEVFLNDIKQEKIEEAIEQLSENYVKTNNITVDNFSESTNISVAKSKIDIIDMLELRIKENHVMRYAVRFKYIDKNQTEKFYNCIVYMDYYNRAYSIEPIDSNINDLSTVELNGEIKEVIKNEENNYIYHLTN